MLIRLRSRGPLGASVYVQVHLLVVFRLRDGRTGFCLTFFTANTSLAAS